MEIKGTTYSIMLSSGDSGVAGNAITLAIQDAKQQDESAINIDTSELTEKGKSGEVFVSPTVMAVGLNEHNPYFFNSKVYVIALSKHARVCLEGAFSAAQDGLLKEESIRKARSKSAKIKGQIRDIKKEISLLKKSKEKDSDKIEALLKKENQLLKKLKEQESKGQENLKDVQVAARQRISSETRAYHIAFAKMSTMDIYYAIKFHDGTMAIIASNQQEVKQYNLTPQKLINLKKQIDHVCKKNINSSAEDVVKEMSDTIAKLVSNVKGSELNRQFFLKPSALVNPMWRNIAKEEGWLEPEEELLLPLEDALEADVANIVAPVRPNLTASMLASGILGNMSLTGQDEDDGSFLAKSALVQVEKSSKVIQIVDGSRTNGIVKIMSWEKRIGVFLIDRKEYRVLK